MKKSLVTLGLVLFLFSCNSENNTDTSKEPAAASENAVGVQNVNGGIPDTTNSIDIGTHQPNEIRGTDSLRMDTLKK